MTAPDLQLSLDLAELVEPSYEPNLSIEERFEVFHALNPVVADTLEAFAAEWLARHDRIGAKALYERARWESGMVTFGEPWALNNDFTASYARLLIARHPEWAAAFSLRARKSERAAA